MDFVEDEYDEDITIDYIVFEMEAKIEAENFIREHFKSLLDEEDFFEDGEALDDYRKSEVSIRSIDDALYGALGRRAAMDNRSISQEVIEIIKRYLATPRTLSNSSDEEALHLAGSWEESKPADELVAAMREERSTRRSSGAF